MQFIVAELMVLGLELLGFFKCQYIWGKAKRRKEPVFKFQKGGIAADCAPSFQENGRRKEAPVKSSFFVKDFERKKTYDKTREIHSSKTECR